MKTIGSTFVRKYDDVFLFFKTLDLDNEVSCHVVLNDFSVASFPLSLLFYPE